MASSESRVPKILSQNASRSKSTNSQFYLSKVKECLKNNNYVEAFENCVNYFDSLDDPANSTPDIQLGFTKLVCRIGIVLEEANDTEELLKIYLQAINFFPNNYVILNNLGGYLFKMGQVDIARIYLEKAVVCSKNYLPAETNLMHCKWHQIPRWHFKMLNDQSRNSAYYKAIKNVISKGFRDVVDVGAGCGLLSLMASDSPEVNVTAIEEHKVLAKMCENIMKANRRSNVKVVNAYSTKLFEPPARCNLLVTEIFDCALFGERMLDTLLHAHHVLITEKNNFKIIPCGARLYASAITYKDSQNFRVVSRVPALSLNQLCIRQVDAEPYEAEDLSTKIITYISKPVKVFDLNFYDSVNLSRLANDTSYSKIIEFDCLEDAVLTSIAVWFELDLDEELTITTDPRREDRAKCWEQAVCHLVHPITVERGENVQFEVTVLESQLKFYQITKPNTCVSCWLVSKEIVSFLNDSILINTILTLANECQHPAFLQRFQEPHKPVIDLMSFPLFGFLLSATLGSQFYTALKPDNEFQNIDFFDHVLRINNIPPEKMITVENKMGHHSSTCGIYEYIKECKACLIDPISTDGSVNSAITLKENMQLIHPDILMLPTKVLVKVVLIYSEQLETWNVVNDKNVFNFKIAEFMNEYTGSEHPDLDSDFTYREYSSPNTFIVDDKNYVKKTQKLLVTESGHINGLYTWYEIQFCETINFSTKYSTHIKKTCYFLDHRPVQLGDVFKVVMRREGTYMNFRIEDN